MAVADDSPDVVRLVQIGLEVTVWAGLHTGGRSVGFIEWLRRRDEVQRWGAAALVARWEMWNGRPLISSACAR